MSAVQAPSPLDEIRVLQVCARFLPDIGGTETHVYETTRRLNRMPGLRVDVLTTDRTGDRPRREILEGTRVRRVRAWPVDRDYYVAPGIRSAIQHGAYDLIHCQGIHNAVPLIAMTAALRAEVPFVVTPHTGGHSSQARNRLRERQWRAIGPLLRKTRRLICVAEFEAEMFARTAHVPAEKIVIVPNGVMIEVPTAGRGPDPGRPTVVCVGRFERYKGQHHLVAAMPTLLKMVPGTRLTLVGSGPAEGALRRQAAGLGVADQVTFMQIPLADRAAMADLLAGAHVVSLLSDYEAHPVAVMEAIALGRPVVVAPTAGLGELARNGFAASVRDPSDSEEVARALAPHLTSAGAAEAHAAGERLDRGIGALTWDECASRLAEIYRESV
jgi:glycosyltransferase involved in cell wall biosynthesis